MRPSRARNSLQLLVGQRGAQLVGHVEPGQRADPVDAVGVAEVLPVGRLEERPGLDRLPQVLPVGPGVGPLGQHGAVVADHPQGAVVVLDGAVGADQAHERRREGAEPGRLLLVAPHLRGVPVQRPPGGGQGLGQAGQDLVAGLSGQGRRHAPGHHPGRVDALAPDRLDHLLAEAAQPDPVAGQLRVGPQHPEQVPAGRLGVEAEQQIRRGQVEEAEGVGLHDLGQVQDPAQVGPGRGRLGGQDLVAGLGRGDQVADRADAADAGHDRRQLVHRPALADALEAAELGDVEVGVGDLAVVVELDGDLGVALDPGHGVDDDLAGHGLGLRVRRRSGRCARCPACAPPAAR